MGLLSFALPRVRDGCFLYVSGRGLAWLILSRRGYAAITFGHVIVSVSEPTDQLWQHERGHVRQYERLGCVFLPLYLILYRRHGYVGHPLEREASAPSSLLKN